MKGIILAGGAGTRLYPLTKSISKQLLPVYDKPMIYYPLSTLMLAGIRDILLIATPADVDRFQELLGDGSQIGINISFKVQEHPKGLAEAFTLGKDFIGNDSVALILGDNIFYGSGLSEIVQRAAKLGDGATVFGYQVADPERFGVVTFDDKKQVVDITEKPENPKSNFAVTGLYFYDNSVTEIASQIKPSPRGELEITDINKAYLAEKRLSVELLGRGFAWLDTGTHESLLQASSFIQTVQTRQNMIISCPEEIAFRMNYINVQQLGALTKSLGNNNYRRYLQNLVSQNS